MRALVLVLLTAVVLAPPASASYSVAVSYTLAGCGTQVLVLVPYPQPFVGGPVWDYSVAPLAARETSACMTIPPGYHLLSLRFFDAVATSVPYEVTLYDAAGSSAGIFGGCATNGALTFAAEFGPSATSLVLNVNTAAPRPTCGSPPGAATGGTVDVVLD